MTPNIKFPYGRSYFDSLIKQGYHYVDKTKYIEWLEKAEESYIFFLRPRRFGKSLFISILAHYYGIEHEANFDTLFGKYYIGQHPTKGKNSFWVLQFNFSGINTNTTDHTQQGFLFNVRSGIDQFIHQYLKLTKAQEKFILSQKEANIMLSLLFDVINRQNSQPVYILIDEYDHFTNELLAFDLEAFREFVGKNGFIRKFYEMIKIGTERGIVEQIFITGVAPITLDSLTSGFNIGSNFSKKPELNAMMGFSEHEVFTLLEKVAPSEQLPFILADMRKWYDGYRFNQRAKEGIYNSDMVLYFLKEYKQHQEYPEDMLDTNISSDYGKLRRLFSLKTPVKNYQILKNIVEGATQTANIVAQFSFERAFTKNDFISLLYYLGFLTIQKGNRRIPTLKVPNYVIQKLYFDFFVARLTQREELPSHLDMLQDSLLEMAYEGTPKPFFQVIERVLTHLSRRDYQNFEEKHIKAIIMALATQTDIFFLKSEREYRGGYTDILFLEQPPFKVKHQYVFELKYIKKKNSKTLATVQQAAQKQLVAYLATDTELKNIKNLQAWTVIVTKDKVVGKRVG